MVCHVCLMSPTLPGPLLSQQHAQQRTAPSTDHPSTQIDMVCTGDASACRAHAVAHSLQVEVGVSVAGDFLVALGMDDLLDFMVDKIIEGVNVLSN